MTPTVQLGPIVPWPRRLSLPLLLLVFAFRLRSISLRPALFPPAVPLMSHLRIVQPLLILVAQLDLVFLRVRVWPIQFSTAQLARGPFLGLRLEPRPLRTGHNLLAVLHQILALVDLHLSLRQLLLGLLFL